MVDKYYQKKKKKKKKKKLQKEASKFWISRLFIEKFLKIKGIFDTMLNAL